MSHLQLQQLVCWGMFAAIPGGLYAADGVVLIDQQSALAGNVTPGDAPGFPVTISQPGSYRLAGNLVVPDSDTTAVRITADSVTLDLNGFSIIGPAGCTGPATTCPGAGQGVGVQAGADASAGPTGVRVMNGSVHGMGRIGILITGNGNFVEKVAAYRNAGGGISVAGMVSQSSAAENGSFGIIAGIVRDCTSSRNVGDGILLAAGGIAAGNLSSENGGYGIWAQYGTVTGNSLFVNQSFGVSAFCPSTIVSNTIASTAGANIETQGAGCVMLNNATRP